MEEILVRYRTLLERVDGWFSACAEACPEQIVCGAGCSSCCRGLFDITLLDAALLQQGLAALPPTLREEARERACRRLPELTARWPDFAPPYVLNGYPDEQWTEMPEDDMTPCPLLGPQGRCLIYSHRPLLCRLHGLPQIDLSGEVFEETWCTLNFTGSDPKLLTELRWEFRATFTGELNLFGEFTTRLLGRPLRELDTFLPTALLIDFSRLDWQNWTPPSPVDAEGGV
ncbi:MAG TPA: YkgJ family cysteine cluster protein [Desulfuromonadales bacterium]|nr:YkgJ family cysteine cluster protein [Desulfuromonadales bacterium]